MKLVFTGIQGSGKGTQARLLAEKYGYVIVEMGGEFRQIMKSGTELGNKIAEIVNAGLYVPEELGQEVMISVLEKYSKEEKIILDGFIRLDWNKELVEKYVPDYKVVLFNLSEEKAISRLLGRMIDSETGESFPNGTEVNPKNGNKLVKRDDEHEEGIKTRISEFFSKTMPLVDLQKTEGRVFEVNADQKIEEVFAELEEKLGL